MSIFDRLGVDLGSVLGVIFGRFGALIGQSWSQSRLRTVLTSKKRLFTKPFKTTGFRRFLAQDGAPRRPKIAPRRVQDRLGSVFLTLDFSLRFLIVLGSILVPFWPPKWHPGSAWIVGKSAPGRSKTVQRSSWFGPFFVLSFGIAFLVVLGSSWGRFWSSWAPLRVVFGRSGGRFGAFSAFQLIDSTRELINSSIQLINSSTHQPMALRHFLTRPGGLRAARLNNQFFDHSFLGCLS